MVVGVFAGRPHNGDDTFVKPFSLSDYYFGSGRHAKRWAWCRVLPVPGPLMMAKMALSARTAITSLPCSGNDVAADVASSRSLARSANRLSTCGDDGQPCCRHRSDALRPGARPDRLGGFDGEFLKTPATQCCA